MDMEIRTPRITLRDFEPADRAAFVAYQMDPRYHRLYGLDDDPARVHALFDRFAAWQREKPRRNFQIGIFDTVTKRLCGCAGLRGDADDSGKAALGIELAPSDWGRYRIAVDVVAHLVEHGFSTLRLQVIVGATASGNDRVRKLAQWFGAEMIDHRDGPDWMNAHGWHEVEWALSSDVWRSSVRRRAILK